MKTKLKKAMKWILFLIGLLIIYFLITFFGAENMFLLVRAANLPYVFAAMFILSVAMLLRGYKWYIMIKEINPKTSFMNFIPIFFFLSMIGYITPMRSGEILSPLIFKRKLKIPVAKGLPIVIFDKFIELTVFVVMMVTALLLFASLIELSNTILRSFFAAIALLLLLLFMISILLFSQKNIMRVLNFFLNLKIRFICRLVNSVLKHLHSFYNALSVFKQRKMVIKLIAITVFGQFLLLLSGYVLTQSILSINIIDFFSVAMISAGIGIASFVPAGIGVTSVSAVYLFGLFGYSRMKIATASLLMKFLTYFVAVLYGLISYIVMKYRDVKRI